jgi:hypothetical protein
MIDMGEGIRQACCFAIANNGCDRKSRYLSTFFFVGL